MSWCTRLSNRFAQVEGTALVECALLISVVSMVALGTISMTGSNVGAMIGSLNRSLSGPPSAQPGAATTTQTTAQAPAKAKKKKHG